MACSTKSVPRFLAPKRDLAASMLNMDSGLKTSTVFTATMGALPVPKETTVPSGRGVVPGFARAEGIDKDL